MRTRLIAYACVVLRVDLDVALLRVLAAALRRHVADGALEDLEQRLLHALAAHVARDRDVARGATDLVDLVDVDDALLRTLDIEVRVLQQAQQDVLYVLADVTRFGEGRRIRDCERNVEDARERARQERLARARGAHEQDVALLEIEFGVLVARVQTAVVAVDGDREHLLGALLADDVFAEPLMDLFW